MIYQFSDCVLDTGSLELRRAGESVALEPQVFRLLVHLIENCERVVTKEELHEVIWKDRSVSDGALTTSINLVRNAVGDDGKNQTIVKTFPRKGFRFVANVVETSSDQPRHVLRSLPQADVPSIAVLPFDDMSSEHDQAYFADGMAEDIITALSRFHWFYVAARHSSFIYKNRTIDVRQVGKELGVRYALEGSVRKGGDRLRISAQLVDTGSGNHLWAGTFDGDLADVFDLQDQITEGVVGAVEPSVQKAEIERARRKRPDSLDAYDLYLQALPHAWVTTKEEMEIALGLLDEALRIDPNYASAHGIATVCCLHLFMRGGMKPAVRDKAILHCRAVIDSKTDDANALAFAGFIYATFTSDKDGAFGAAERAIALNPNGARTLTNSGMVHVIFGDYGKAIEFASRAIRLNPLDPMRYGPECLLSFGFYHSGSFVEAAEAAVRSIQSNSKFIHALAMLAASNVQLGKMNEAAEAAKRLIQIAPEFRASAINIAPVGPPEKMELLVADLISAGLPE